MHEPAEVVEVRPVDAQHQVVSVQGGPGTYRRWPCSECPWRVDQTGAFPAEAFAQSAPTAYDLAERTFGCHEAGTEHPAVCAGFLLRGAQHNLAVRLRVARGQLDLSTVHDGGHELHADYRTMAVANGLPADDPRLGPCGDAPARDGRRNSDDDA